MTHKKSECVERPRSLKKSAKARILSTPPFTATQPPAHPRTCTDPCHPFTYPPTHPPTHAHTTCSFGADAFDASSHPPATAFCFLNPGVWHGHRGGRGGDEPGGPRQAHVRWKEGPVGRLPTRRVREDRRKVSQRFGVAYTNPKQLGGQHRTGRGKAIASQKWSTGKRDLWAAYRHDEFERIVERSVNFRVLSARTGHRNCP